MNARRLSGGQTTAWILKSRKWQSGLVRTQLFDNVRKVINMASAAGAVEPELDQLAIVLSELIQLRSIVFVISDGILIPRFVPVPGRKINPEFQTIFSGRV